MRTELGREEGVEKREGAQEKRQKMDADALGAQDL